MFLHCNSTKRFSVKMASIPEILDGEVIGAVQIEISVNLDIDEIQTVILLSFCKAVEISRRVDRSDWKYSAIFVEDQTPDLFLNSLQFRNADI